MTKLQRLVSVEIDIDRVASSLELSHESHEIHQSINHAMKCTCGANCNRTTLDREKFQAESVYHLKNTLDGSCAMDASFVNLPKTMLHTDNPFTHVRHSPDGVSYQDHNRIMAWLYNSTIGKEDLSPPLICQECTKRLQEALVIDSDLLNKEHNDILLSIRDEKKRYVDLSMKQQELARVESSFLSEIQSLEEACRQQEGELLMLQSVRKQQSSLSKELDLSERELSAERNGLEVSSRAFDNNQDQLYRFLVEVEGEVDRLSSCSIRLPSLLFDLHVDKERGRLYPMINELRLAYRPKGDIQWEEIQAAWSLAAQLLLCVANVFHFQSRHWRIIPLSNCSKLLFYPPKSSLKEGSPTKNEGKASSEQASVYNLGHPLTNSAKAMLVWNALLHQLCNHVVDSTQKALSDGLIDAGVVPPIPFPMTSVQIGPIVMTDLDANDDAGWSKAIHCMCSNLLWLSDCSSTFLMYRVTAVSAHCT